MTISPESISSLQPRPVSRPLAPHETVVWHGGGDSEPWTVVAVDAGVAWLKRGEAQNLVSVTELLRTDSVRVGEAR